jgi:ribosomal-protein-alanine N-acetyltransferase
MHRLFETEHLNVFVLDQTGAKQLLAYELKNREYFQQYSIARNDSYYTLPNFLCVCENQHKLYEQKRKLPLLLVKKGGERIIGTVNLNEIVLGVFRSCTLGYSIDAEMHRQGLGREAVSQVVDYAFNTLFLHRIEANIMPRNRASLALAESLGFCNEGLSKRYLYINGKWEDHVNMVLLNDTLDMQKIR